MSPGGTWARSRALGGGQTDSHAVTIILPVVSAVLSGEFSKHCLRSADLQRVAAVGLALLVAASGAFDEPVDHLVAGPPFAQLCQIHGALA
jgi:hypothetical protein